MKLILFDRSLAVVEAFRLERPPDLPRADLTTLLDRIDVPPDLG